MQIGKVTVACNAHVTAEIELIVIGRSIAGTGSIGGIDGIGQALTQAANRKRAAKLNTNSVAWNKVAWQWVVGNLVEPSGAAFAVSAQRQQHQAANKGGVVAKSIVQRGKTKADGGAGTAVVGSASRCGRGGVLQCDIESGLKEDVVVGTEEKDGRKIGQRKGAVRSIDFAELNLGVARQSEIVRCSWRWRHRMDRLNLGC